MIIDRWQTGCLVAGPVRIYPDGCRDVIWEQLPGRAPVWKISNLDAALRVFRGAGGATMRGFRLAPGTGVDEARLLAVLDPEAPDKIDAIADQAVLAADTLELMQAFRSDAGANVAHVARRVGVSPRQLQRHVRAQTGQSPLFWLRLFRLRQALADARSGTPLVEAAMDAGFADQSHFTRETRAFHGAPPGKLLADSRALALVLAPGL